MKPPSFEPEQQTMTLEEQVKLLARQAPGPPGEELPSGASPASIAAFEQRVRLLVPASLREWLLFCNGPCIGPGGLFGIHPRRSDLDMEAALHRHSQWIDRAWLPVGGDGCGNYYLLESRGCTQGVYFVEMIEGGSKLTYSVGSGLWIFLWLLLSKETGARGWPFDKDYVLAHDPDIVHCSAAPLPWEA